MTFEAQSCTAMGSGEANQDLALVGAGWALVLDGASPPAGVDVGCGHGVAWIVERLGVHLRDCLNDRKGTLADTLLEAIRATVADHGPRCDMSTRVHPAPRSRQCASTATGSNGWYWATPR